MKIILDALPRKLLRIHDVKNDGSPSKSFVLEIPRGRVIRDYGVVITPDHRLLAEVSPALGGEIWTHDVLFDWWLPPSKKVDKRVAVLSSHAHQRYFHWMFDVLPRFDILSRSQVQADLFVVNQLLPYQIETIAHLPISPDKIMDPSLSMHIEAQTLIVPSLPGPAGTVNQQSCDYLRSLFLRKKDGATHPNEIVYVSRRDALTRRVINEEEIIKSLIKYNVKVVALDGMSVREQANLFSGASIVMGPHGAAFANAVFERGDLNDRVYALYILSSLFRRIIEPQTFEIFLYSEPILIVINA